MVGFMPRAMRVDRLLGEHGIGQDSAAGRQEFERQMERRRLETIDEEALKPLRRGWYLGSEQFKEQMLELMEGKVGESQSGELHRETAEQRANRIIAEGAGAPGLAGVRVGHSPAQRPRQAGQRCPAAERNDPADQADCGAGADGHGQMGQVRTPSSGSEPRPTQNRKSPRTMRPARIPIYGLPPFPEGEFETPNTQHRLLKYHRFSIIHMKAIAKLSGDMPAC
jgi:hypothetical protein